jgi:F-type H+-transporting ATPase subunit epsilon
MLKLKIVTPTKLFFSGFCKKITIPGECGEFQILEGHSNILSSIKIGILKFDEAKDLSNNSIKNKKIITLGGFIKIEKNNIDILSNAIILKSEINKEKEKSLIKEKTEILLKLNTDNMEKYKKLTNLINISNIKLNLLN